MIDLHCHILPGLDDGPADAETSLAMARAAQADGIQTIAATPHIRGDHPVSITELAGRRTALNDALSDAGIAVRVVGGGELALSRLPELDDQELAEICLGDGNYVLVEAPYTPVADLVEGGVFSLQARGFRPLLAHPERSPAFLGDRPRLAELVRRGVLCSVTAASLSGRFGRQVRHFACAMFREGLVHNVASDAHDPVRRAPGLSAGLEAIEQAVPGAGAQRDWLTREVPASILAGEDAPPRPQPPDRRRRPLGRWFERARRTREAR